MIIQQDTSSALYQIQRYESGKIWINGQIFETSVIIRPQSLLVPWEPKNLNELNLTHFKSIFDDPPEILLLGTGQQMLIPPRELINAFIAKNIGIEFMDSKAACFTYMALACEDRSVAACILIE